MSEIFGLSDRIAVIFRGEILGIYRNRDLDIEKIGLLMAGYTGKEAKPTNSKVRDLLVTNVLAVVAGLAVSGLLLLFLGENPLPPWAPCSARFSAIGTLSPISSSRQRR